MVRIPVVMICMAGLAMAGLASRQQAEAQSGKSLVFAEHACLDYGVPTNTPIFASCVDRAARAFDRGEPDLAYMQARATRDARDSCQAFGMSTDTSSYRQCVDRQVERHIEH